MFIAVRKHPAVRAAAGGNTMACWLQMEKQCASRLHSLVAVVQVTARASARRSGIEAWSKWTRPTYAELKPARPSGVSVVVNGDAVIEAQRTNGQIEAQAKAPVVAEVTR